MNPDNKNKCINGSWFRILLVLFVSLCWVNLARAADDLCKPPTGNIARAMFTTAIDNREPVNRVLILENNFSELYFFTDLRHFQGKTIKHRWEYEGRTVDEKTFEVKGPRWRVYSLHKMDRNMLGRWTVVVTDEKDCPLKAVIFQYVQAGSSSGAAIINLRGD
jgi:hypothetical protein